MIEHHMQERAVGISVGVNGSSTFPACIKQEHSSNSCPSVRSCGNQSLISFNCSKSQLGKIILTKLRHAETANGHTRKPKLMQVNMSQVFTLIKHKQSLYPPQRRCCSSRNSSTDLSSV
jgi:hypothetical protein